jgi:hypothetical protein
VDSEVAVAAAVALEDLGDEVSDGAVCELAGGGLSGVVVVAAGDAEGGADLTDSVAGGGVNVGDHLAKLGGVLVPRMTAAFLKCRSPL